MARTVTVTQLTTRTRRRADMPATGFVTDPEILDVLNDEMPEVYRLLVEVGPPDYYSADTSITIVSGRTSYSLPADFFQETTIYLSSGGYRYPLVPVQDWGLSRMRVATSDGTVVMEYVPSPPVWTAGTDTFDGIAGWDSLLTARAARRMMQKRKADTSSLDAEIGQLTQHLRAGARRSKGPRYMRDVDDVSAINYPLATRATKYRIRAGNIEIYEPILTWPI